MKSIDKRENICYYLYIDIQCIVKLCLGEEMKISKELLKGSTSIMILKIISEQDSYGYQITQILYKRSNEFLKLNEGTLYPILHSMEREGYIESYKKASETGRERKYYRITALGNMHLAGQIKEWEVFSSSVNKVLTGE